MNIHNIYVVGNLWETLKDLRFRISILKEKPHLVVASILDKKVGDESHSVVVEALLAHLLQKEQALVDKLTNLGVDISEPKISEEEE